MPHPLLLLALATLAEPPPQEPLTLAQPWTYRWQLTVGASFGERMLTGHTLFSPWPGTNNLARITDQGGANVGVNVFLKPLRDEAEHSPRELQPFLEQASAVWASGGGSYATRHEQGTSLRPLLVGKASAGAYGYPVRWLFLAVDASFDRTTNDSSTSDTGLPKTNLWLSGTAGLRMRDVLVSATYRTRLGWTGLPLSTNREFLTVGWGGVELGIRAIVSRRWDLQVNGRVYDFGKPWGFADPPTPKRGGGFNAGVALFVTNNVDLFVVLDYFHDRWDTFYSGDSLKDMYLDSVHATGGVSAWLTRRVGLTISAAFDWAQEDSGIETSTHEPIPYRAWGGEGDVRVNIRL